MAFMALYEYEYYYYYYRIWPEVVLRQTQFKLIFLSWHCAMCKRLNSVAYPEIQNGGVRHLGPLPSHPLPLWRALASLEKFFWTKDARRCVLSAFSTQK